MDAPRYIVGIDLGTTHCVLAYTELGGSEHEASDIRVFDVLQVVGPGEVEARPLLPSFLLFPGPHEVPEGGLNLPWKDEREVAVGEYARTRGAELPSRLVSSAKSWLSHTGVDRNEAILPWEAPEGARRVSPVEAATLLLTHLRDAWNYRVAGDDPSARLESQEIYLTVPASFDAVARELTVQAAHQAGIDHFTLLEEPTAAFYAWIHARGEAWRREVQVGESILVCDVGGGTTDFSLIEVVEEEGSLDLRRVAVGDHILLGGDNMDLTLAYAIRSKLASKGTNLDAWQFRGLSQSCRRAKERLLGDSTLDSEPIVVVGRGSALIGGTIRTELTRAEVESVLLEGFFPGVGADEFPEQKPRIGVREMGLPFAADPAITRHLALFLSRQVASGEAGVAFPSAVLFNGGVMKASVLRDRVMGALQRWGGEVVRELPSHDLDRAVSVGSVYYGLARRGRGIRIRAGASRSYYIGVESSMPAVPGIPTPVNALCVVPFGMEEGSTVEVREREFGLVVGEPAVFPLLAASTRQEDRAGETVEDWGGEFQEVSSMQTLLPATDAEQGGTIVPVWLESRFTEIGTLELWCVARNSDRRWKLEFNVRDQGA